MTFAVEGSLSYPSLLHVNDVGLVRVLLANPLVMSHAPLLLRETMRIARKKALLYETGTPTPPYHIITHVSVAPASPPCPPVHMLTLLPVPDPPPSSPLFRSVG